MSEARVPRFLAQAEEKEKTYDWLGAVELHKKAFEHVLKQKDFLKAGEVQEKIGYCLYRGAFQAEIQEEFKRQLRQAIEACKEAQAIFEKLVDERKVAWMFRCKAVAKYIGYWLTSEPPEKRRLLDECLELGDKSLAVFLEYGNMLEYGRTYNKLLPVFLCRVSVEWDRQTVKDILERGVEWGEKAVAALSKLGESFEIAKAYFTLADCLALKNALTFAAEPEEIDKKRSEVVKYMSEVVELSEKVGDAYLLGLSHFWLGYNTASEEAVRHCEKTVECGKRTRDNLLIAMGLDLLAYWTVLNTSATEDPEKRRELAEKAMQFYEKGEHYCSIISFLIPRGGAMSQPGGYAEHYLRLASWETDPKKRREFLEKSEKAGIEALKLAEDSDMPAVIVTVLNTVSVTLATQAHLESDHAKKRSRLEMALTHRQKVIEIQEQIAPFHYWNMGGHIHNLAKIKTELADIEPDLDSKRRLLEDAVLDEEKSLKLRNKEIPYWERMGQTTHHAWLQRFQDSYATLLTRLYSLSNKPEHLKKAIEILQQAIESASKAELVSLKAESYWKIAKAQGILGEHLEAAEKFEHASQNYMKAVKKIPQLKNFYQDHASYMQAWSEIEKAREQHAKREYGRARDHYEKAANFHESTERWNYLSPNYLAWARLEEAEDLSRREHTEEAKGLFQQAANLFVRAKKSIKAKLEKIESKDEKAMLVNLAKASDVRHEYSLGRIALEEAKILDRQGDHDASSKKYGSAAEKFRKAIDSIEEEADRRELKPIVCLCQAWQKMTRAEAEASPDLYLEASQLFEEAKSYSLDEKTRMLTLGHSIFCKALEAGAKFEAAQDTSLYTLATQHLESAGRYYLRAGLKSASAYSEATQKLLDAYLYMYDAKIEADPAKKARFYLMAEKVLQASAGSYLKAKHREKQEQVSSLLEKVRKEKELALSLSEVLHAPLATSTTATFTTPSPTEETAIGLERFEHADIQANLIFRAREVKVGEDMNLVIELVNAGKAPALLIKVDEIIPEGFEIREEPEIYTVEGSFLNMKGKRLNPLKTEDVKMVVRPKAKGTFRMKPRILYIDETGKYKSHEPEPVTITVKELGIKGWIGGES